jgi:4-hydroxybenzoyl-CoA thioesterase
VTSPAIFEREALIRFAHCDPAGMVFYPQYLVLFNGLVEDWFEQSLGLGFGPLVRELGVGLPTVALQCEFSGPSRMGERVMLGLAVQRLGSKSITLELSCHCADEVRVKATQVLVTTELATDQAIALPAPLRAAIERFQTESAA